jgi:hypothetical protein
MRRLGRTRHGTTSGERESAGAHLADSTAEAREVVRMAERLHAMVEAARPDEFYWQEAHYDRASLRGRELLFLMSNHEWVRNTSEIVNITRSDAIETSIKVDIDLGQITHEAFRKKSGTIWLPIAVLMPEADQHRFEPDLSASVTGPAGEPVRMMAATEMRHQISAAMAEIITKMAVSHMPNSAAGAPEVNLDDQGIRSIGRDEKLLLSAAIFRILQGGSGGVIDPSGYNPATGEAGFLRIEKARKNVLWLLGYYNNLLERVADAASSRLQEPGEPQFAPELARRAVKVLQALSESVIVVVLVDYADAPLTLTVDVPNRKLEVAKPSLIRPWTWVLRPCGRLEIDMLLPTADANRQIQVNLPEGVSLEQPDRARETRGGEFPYLAISVHEPTGLHELRTSMDQILAPSRRDQPIAPLRPIVDLACMKAESAAEIMRHYQARDKADGTPVSRYDYTVSGDPCAELQELAKGLRQVTDITDDTVQRLAGTWQNFAASKRFLFRHTVTDLLNAKTVVARAEIIEDTAHRATPKRAAIVIDLTVDDRDYFSGARTSVTMSLILMAIVLAFLHFWPIVNPKAPPPSADVLAIVITLFATIQADRIARPDRSTLRGQLFAIGGWLTFFSVLPSLTLAVALAFDSNGGTAVLWACGCIAGQLVVLLLMLRGPLTPAGRPRIGKHRVISTEVPDYRHFEVLRSDYWRNTTADALMIGRKAYGFVVWQKAAGEEVSPKLRPLLIWDIENESAPSESNSLLALLRSGTMRQALTFMVFRGQPPRDGWPVGMDHSLNSHPSRQAYEVAELDLDPDRLAPPDSVASTADIFIGIQRDKLLTIKEHPLAVILKAVAGKLIVLDIQLPFPTPVPGHHRMQWARIKVALRDSADIRRLASFIDAIQAAATKLAGPRHVVAVRAARTAPPRVIRAFPPKADHELGDVASSVAANEEPDAQTWRVLAICAAARSNMVSNIVQGLASIRDRFQLVGLTYALLHGTVVIFMLVHEPPVDDGLSASAGEAPRNQEEDSADLEADLRRVRGLSEVRILVDRRTSRLGLDSPSDRGDPLLAVRFRWPDRPGAFMNMLDIIARVLSEELPAVKQKDWSVSFARLRVLTGQVALGRLTIHMRVPPESIADWTPGKMATIRKKIEDHAEIEGVRQEVFATSRYDMDNAEATIIAIDRVEREPSD